MDFRLGFILVLALAAGGTLAGPIQNSRNCARKQCSVPSKFTYRTGQTYQYRYDGRVATRVNGASEGQSGIQMSAIVHIEVITPCEFALKLTEVSISELDSEGRPRRLLGTELFRRSLEADTLRFSFQDGRIEEVCPLEREATWITNIKRGVLSSIQNNMENLQRPTTKHETDITGRCQAEYLIAENTQQSVTVDRRKDLLACTDRHGYKTAFQATPYRVQSDIQSMPLTKSSHNCRQTIHSSGYLSQVECQETHVFRPFSKDNNGAFTEASHKLVYQRQRPGVTTTLSSGFRRTDLLYEHDGEQTTSSNNDNNARQVLRDICQHATDDVRPETPKLFSELVYKLKQLDSTTLNNLHRAVQNGQVCATNLQAAKKFFHDAIPMTGTVASVKLISQLIRSGQVTGKEAEMWLLSLAFIQEPKQEMISSVKELLLSNVQTQRNYLSASALINNYCRHNAQCQSHPALTQIVRLLESKLNGNCRVAQSRDQDRMLMTLKALSNMKVATGAAATLGRCAAEEQNPIEIRLAALDALKNQPCEAERSVALRLFRDRNQEDEIRISAYLSGMKCATAEVINQVKQVLESETANQVGSFVWTHLTNLMESDDPHKAEIRNILNNVYLRKEFDMDRRKFSRNYEGSVFLDSINTGAKLESNVIWSRKSFVPRSAMMNLTVDLFGHSVNLLEVGGRVEGMEQLLEKFFGPDGYFPEKTIMNTLRREKRQVADQKLGRIDRTYDGKGNQDNIKGNMYFKIFGNELGYMDLLNLRSASEFNILEILIKLAQNHEVEFNKSVMFLDTSVTIPTIVGLPLRLAVNGTATVNLALSGKLDVRRAHPAPRSLDIDGKVRTSAAVQIASMMSLDAGVARTGLKMITTLHSSTELDGKLQVQDSKVVQINFNMPRDKQEIISVDNKFFTVHDTEEKEQRMTGNERVEESRCTGDKLIKMTGLQLCGEVSYPLASNIREAPFYPLTGPSRMAIHLHKRDTHTAYQFEARMLTEKIRRDGFSLYKRTARLAFNTPGSQTDRNLLFDFILDQPNKAMKLQVDTPWKKLGLEGSMMNEPAMKRASLRMNLDEETEYSMRAEIRVDQKPQGKVFYPNVNIKLPQRDPIQLTGNIAYKQPSSVSFNLRLVDLFASPVKVSGSTTYDPLTKRLNTETKLECPLVDASAEGFFEMNPQNHRSRFNIKYTRPRRPEESITLHYKLRNTRTGSLTKFSVDTSISNTLYPEYNNKITWALQKTGSHAETTLDVFYGDTMDDPGRRLQASVITNYQVARTNAELDAVVALNFPAKNINFRTTLDHKHNQRMLSTKASVNYANNQNAEVLLSLNNLSTNRLKLSSSFRFKYPGRDIMYRQAIDERQLNEFHHSLMLQWQVRRVFTSKDVFKKVGDVYSLNSEINCPGQTPINLNGLVKANALNAKLAASYEKDGRKYGGEAAYDVTLGRTLKVDANLMVVMPGRKHMTAVAVHHDADRTSAGFKYDWLKQGQMKTISLKLGARHRLQPNDKVISGSIELDTPYSPVEKIAARFQYTAQNQQHNANVGVTWAPEKTISLEGSGRVVSWRDFQISGAINTPFDGYRRLASNLRSRILDGVLNLAVNGQKQDQRVDLELGATWQDKISGSFKFRVPNVAHSLQGGFSHERQGNRHIININGVWNDLAYSALVKGMVNSLWDVEAGVIITTPVPGYQRTEAAYRHYYQGRNAEGLLKVAFAERQVKLQFNTSNNSNYRNRDILVNAEIMTPFQQLRIGKITVKYFNNGGRYSSQVTGMYNDMSLGYDLNMNNNYQAVTSNGNLKISTPLPGYQQIIYTWNHRFTANVLSTNEVRINGLKYVMRINGNHNIGDTNQMVNGQMTIETPHAVFRNAVLNIKYENSPYKLATSGTLSVNGNTAAFSLDATGSRRNRLVCNFNLNLEPLLTTYTPYSLRPITASLTFDGQMRPNNLVSFIRYGVNKEIRVEGSFDYRGANYITGNLIVNTPYPILNRVSLQMKHERQGVRLDSQYTVSWGNDQSVHLKGIFTHGSTVSGEVGITTPFDVFKKFSFKYTHKREVNSQFVHTNNLLVEFLGERITFDSGATYQGSRYVTSYARFTSPFEKYRNMAYSFSTKKEGGQRISSFDVELSPGKKSEIALTYKLNPIDMTLSIRTPCHHLSSFQAKLKHEHRMPYINSQASFDMVTFNSPLSGAMTLQMQSVEDMTFRITATDDILIELTNKAVRGTWETNLKGRAMGESVTAETKLDLSSPSFELKVSTPFVLRTLNTDVRVNLDQKVVSLGFSALYNEKNYRANLNANLAEGLDSGRLTMVYSSDTVPNADLKVSFYRRREGPVYKAGIQGSYNDRKITMDTQFQRIGKYIGSILVKTPFPGHERYETSYLIDREANRKLILKFNVNTPLYGFKSLKLDYDHRGTWTHFEDRSTFEFDASISRIFYTDEWKVQGWLNSIEASGRLLTPFKNAEYTSYEIRHNLRGQTYDSKVTLEYAPGRRVVLENELNLSEGLKCETTITSPNDLLRRLNLKMNHRGYFRDFTCACSFNYNDLYSAGVDLETREFFPLSANVRFSRPNAEPISASMTQDLTRGKFEHNFNLNLGNGKTNKLAINVNTQNNIEASLDLETSCRYIPMLKINLMHTPRPLMNKFTLDARTSEGPITFRTNFNLNSVKDVKLSAHFNCWYEYLRDLSLAYHHQVEDWRTSDVKLSVGFAPEKVIALSAKVNYQDPQNGRLEYSLTTPFEVVRSAVLVSQKTTTGDWNMESSDKLMVNGVEVWRRTMKFRSLNNIEFEEVNSRWYSIHFTSRKSDNIRSNKLKVTWLGDDEGIELDINYRLRAPMMEIKMKTPWEYLSDASLKLDAGTRSQYTRQGSAQFTMTHNLLPASISGTASWNIPMSINVRVQTPFQGYENVLLECGHAGDITQFTTTAKLQYKSDRIIETRLFFKNINNFNNIETKLTLKTPYELIGNPEFSFKHQGNLNKFSCDAALVYMTTQRISAVLNFEKNPAISGSLVVTTPFRNWERRTLTFSHRGHPARFTTEVKVTCQRGLTTGFKVDSTVHNMRRTSIIATVFTPVDGYNQIQVRLNFMGSRDSVKRSVTYIDPTNGRFEVSAEVSGRPLAVKLTLSCPHGSAVLSHTGDLSGFNSGLNVQYVNNKKIDVKVTWAPNPNMELKIESPWAEVTLTHNGEIDDFTTTAMATVRGVRVTSEVRFRLNPSLALNVQFTSPMCAGQLNLMGVARNFRALASGSWAGDNQKVELNWSVNEDIAAGIKTTGTIPRFEHIEASFSHKYRRFSPTVSVQWTRTDRLSATLNYKYENGRRSAELKVNTPFQNHRDLSAGIFFNENYERFVGGLNVQYADNGRIELNAHYNHKTDGQIILKTPFEPVNNVKVDFRSATIERKEGYIITVRWAPTQAVQIKVAGILNGNVEQAFIDGYLEINTPNGDLRNLVIEALHRHSRSELATTLKAKYNGDAVFHTIFDLEFSESTLRGHTTMIRPLPVKLTLDLAVQPNMKKADVEFNWDSRNPQATVKLVGVTRQNLGRNSVERSVTLTLPTRTVKVSNEYMKSRTVVKIATGFTWDQARNRQVLLEAEYRDTSRSRAKMFEASGKLTTPLRTMLATVAHSESGGRYSSSLEFMWDLLRAPQKKITILGVAQLADNGSEMEVTIRPPGTHEIKLRRESKYRTEDIIFWKLYSLSYSPSEDDKLTVIYDVRDKLVGRHHNYSASFLIKHPSSNIRLHTIGHVGASYRSRTAGFQVNYMKADGQLSQIHLLGDFDTEDNKGKFMILTPIRSVELIGGLTRDRYGYRLSQQTIYDGERVWWTLDLNKRNASINFNLHYDRNNPNKAFKLVGWYLPNQAEIRALHYDGSSTEVWGLASAKLNSSKVLLTRLHWKPSLLQQIKEESESRTQEMNNAIRNEISVIQRALITEVDQRRDRLTTPDLSLTTNAIQQEAASFRSDYQMTMNALGEMVDSNEFFMQDARDAASDASQIIAERVEVMRYQLRRALSDYKRTVRQSLNMIRRQLDQFMANLEEMIAAVILKFRPAWQSYAYSAIRSVQEAHQRMAHGWERFQEQAAENQARIARFFDDRFDFITYKVESFMNKWTTVPDNVFSTEETSFFVRLQEKLRVWVEKVRERFNEIYGRIHDKMLILRDAVQRKVDEIMAKIMQYRAAQIVVNYVKQVYYHAVDAWEAWEVPKTICEMTKTLYREMKAYAREYGQRLLKQYMRVENSGFTVFDPKNGEIQAAIWLPLEIQQLGKMPKINLEQAKLALQRLKDRYMPNSDYSIWDTYYKYKPNPDPLEWIPPFRAHAMLAHGKHYRTFDGRHYDFAGTCSYVLARDFIDGNFTVVANYRQGAIHSLMVVTNEKKIEIFDDYKVTIDDRRTELPVQHLNTTVVRQGYKITVHNERGVTVTCDLHNKICTTNITGWYYGKTAGLFGTYNNEQDDDMLTSERRTTTDLNEFTRSWEIGQNCPGSRNLARQTPQTSNPEIQSICDNYFKQKHSLFRPCFKQVDPRVYLDMCISDLQQRPNDLSLHEAACRVSAAYIAECKLVGVDMPQHSTCATCQKPEGGSYLGAITLNRPREELADIVLLVEEKPCNRHVVSRLETLVNIMDNSLKAKGMTNTRYAVVGFGGRGVHDPFHVHTMEGHIFNEARKIRPAIQSLDFSESGHNNDVLGAVYDASKLTFRTGASKSIVVIPCSDCEARTIGYAALQQILSEYAIHLHVMAQHEFALRTNSPKTNYLFGIDNSAAYTMYHVNQRDLSGDPHLHRQVVMPKTLCSALALSQNGSVFNVNKLTEGRTRTKKSFIDIFARRVAKTAKPLECQMCECIQDQDGAGKSVCRSCEMPTYNSFFKKFFPKLYQHNYVEAWSGTDKAEMLPEPIPAPTQLEYEEAQ